MCCAQFILFGLCFQSLSKDRIIYAKQVKHRKRHCIATQTDDYGCNSGCSCMYINADPVHETLPPPLPSVTVDSQYSQDSISNINTNNKQKDSIIFKEHRGDDWIEYQCKSGQTIFLYNKVTGEHKWPPEYNDVSLQCIDFAIFHQWQNL